MSRVSCLLIPVLIASASWTWAASSQITREQAEALIDRLAEIDQEDGGFSDQWTTAEFPPAPWQWTWADSGTKPPQRKHAPALLELVDAGPSALALLAHLDDPRPTRLAFKRPEIDGSMWYAAEVPLEPAAFDGVAMNEPRSKMPDDEKYDPGSIYQVKVGDICFAITGIITNRPYCGARRQHKRSIVINSPVAMPEIAAKVRDLWPNPGDPSALRQSLEADLERGNRGAAARLLYYFPQESTAKVHARLQTLIAEKSAQLPVFLDSVSWAPDAAIRGTIRTLISDISPTEYKLIAYGAPAFSDRDRPELRDEILALLKRWRTAGRGATNGQRLLVIALETWPDQAADTLTRYLAGTRSSFAMEAAQACYDTGIAPVSPLRGLLDRDESGDGEYLIDGAGVHKNPRRNNYCGYRIKDHAYELISRSLGDKAAVCTGDRAAMDARIATLKQRLTGDPVTWPFSAQEIAGRQTERELPATARTQLLEKIRAAEADPLRHAVLILEQDGVSLDDWREAAAYLYGRPDGLSSNPRAITDPGLDEPCRLDAFPVEWQQRCITVMAKRCLELWQKAGEDHYPSEEAASFLSLAGRRRNEETKELRLQALQRLEAASRKQDFPGRDFLRPTLCVASQLLIWQTPGAAEWFAAFSSRATPEPFKSGSFGEVEFLMVFAEFAYLEPLAVPAERLFLDQAAPWNPVTMDPWKASDIGAAVPLRIPAFRKALLQAIRDNPKRSDIVAKLSIDERKSCSIEFNHGGSMGRSCAPPYGAEPGGPPMEIRQVDALLDAIVNQQDGFYWGFFWDRAQPKPPGTPPAFQMHWPLDKREEAIREWLSYLEK